MTGDVEVMLRRIVEGDREAAAWLYDSYAPALYRKLRRRYGYLSEADWEDLLHASFVQVFRNDFRLLRRFRERKEGTQGGAELGRFLWDQCCGLVANHRRKAAFRREVSLEFSDRVIDGSDSEDQALNRQLLELLYQCLRRSDGRLHLYFKLRYRDGFTPVEISRICGWSSQRTYKLKQKLDQTVKACAEELDLGPQ